MADTSRIEDAVEEAYFKLTGGLQQCNSTDYNMKTLNCVDANGDLMLNDCDILPNNNLCESMGFANCFSDGSDCDINIKNYVSSHRQDSNSPAGESNLNFSGPESTTTHSLCSSAVAENISHHFESQQINQQSHLFMAVPPAERPSTNSTNSSDLNNGVVKKGNKNAKFSQKKLGINNVRGRPRKTLVAMYHSQISGDKNAIKIRIKKSDLSSQLPPNKKKSGRRKKKVTSDTDASDYESNNKRVKFDPNIVSDVEYVQEPLQQSFWGQQIPHNVLYSIFQIACAEEGSLPLLARLCRVCKLWRDVALSPSLWNTVDLNYVQERFRNDLKLHWLIRNRLTSCHDLNLGDWKIRDIPAVLQALSEHCRELRGLSLNGWKGLNADHLKYLTAECNKLERLDLSSINNTSAINAQPLVNLAQRMGNRLTHLILAHNKLAGFTQVMASIAANCPNLELLDISNIRTFAHNTALLHVEKLQIGCPKLRVLRITNSQIWLAPTSLSDQVAAPGFPMLEELSLAGIEKDQITARSIGDDGIERILKNSTKLRLLDVRGCIRLTDSGLVRVPAWDLEHLFLSACYVTRIQNSGLELIVQKWSHSLVEIDLAWSTSTISLDAAVLALAEKAEESSLRILNLCGSSVSLDPVKAVLKKCPKLYSINLQSCRALPRGIKRLYAGEDLNELRLSLQDKPKTESVNAESEKSTELTA